MQRHNAMKRCPDVTRNARCPHAPPLLQPLTCRKAPVSSGCVALANTTSRTSMWTSPRCPGGVYRGLGVRQVVAGLLHALCRSPATLFRVRRALCAAADRPSGRAGRRQHRGPAAGSRLAATARHPSARSSVGSVTTLSSLIRMLYSRAGSYPADQPMLYAEDFSPNTPQGACQQCHGLGRVYEVTEASMVPDPSLTIRERAVAAWPMAWQGQNLRDILVTLGYDVDILARPAKKQRDWILFTEETPPFPYTPGSPQPRPAPPSNASSNRVTKARSAAPGATCCIPSCIRKAHRCANAWRNTCAPAPARCARASASNARR